MSVLSLNTEQYSNYARTLNPNFAFQDHNTNPQITTQPTLSAVYFPHRVLKPCALQSSAFNTKNRPLDHFSTPIITCSAGGLSRGPWLPGTSTWRRVDDQVGENACPGSQERSGLINSNV